jgi:cytochrome c oxidase subunit 2
MKAAALTGLAVGVLLGVAMAQDGDPLRGAGERAFTQQGCYGCHMVGKFGTPIGPDLSRVGQKYSREYLARWLRDPESQRPSAHMPKLELSPEDVRALAAFLSTLR